ncbi:tetratricopeptide repeat protein [Streptomyces sp. V4I8]|uniref:tetratricopeptide repeat protein n=1 Tax=Streptomyces sp. V4I8 TaxID=3156469 RepID=UPI0035188728
MVGLRELGRTEEAVAALEEVIERRERALGPEHPLVASNRVWLTEWQAEAQP